jgi:hypothetical protein
VITVDTQSTLSRGARMTRYIATTLIALAAVLTTSVLAVNGSAESDWAYPSLLSEMARGR